MTREISSMASTSDGAQGAPAPPSYRETFIQRIARGIDADYGCDDDAIHSAWDVETGSHLPKFGRRAVAPQRTLRETRRAKPARRQSAEDGNLETPRGLRVRRLMFNDVPVKNTGRSGGQQPYPLSVPKLGEIPNQTRQQIALMESLLRLRLGTDRDLLIRHYHRLQEERRKQAMCCTARQAGRYDNLGNRRPLRKYKYMK